MPDHFRDEVAFTFAHVFEVFLSTGGTEVFFDGSAGWLVLQFLQLRLVDSKSVHSDVYGAWLVDDLTSLHGKPQCVHGGFSVVFRRRDADEHESLCGAANRVAQQLREKSPAVVDIFVGPSGSEAADNEAEILETLVDKEGFFVKTGLEIDAGDALRAGKIDEGHLGGAIGLDIED